MPMSVGLELRTGCAVFVKDYTSQNEPDLDFERNSQQSC